MPSFVCHFKGSLHPVNWTVASTAGAATTLRLGLDLLTKILYGKFLRPMCARLLASSMVNDFGGYNLGFSRGGWGWLGAAGRFWERHSYAARLEFTPMCVSCLPFPTSGMLLDRSEVFLFSSLLFSSLLFSSLLFSFLFFSFLFSVPSSVSPVHASRSSVPISVFCSPFRRMRGRQDKLYRAPTKRESRRGELASTERKKEKQISPPRSG